MRAAATTSFTLLGKRRYVHSTQIFTVVADLAARCIEHRGEPTPVMVRNFKFTRETDRNGTITIGPRSDIETATAASTLNFTLDGEEHVAAFVDDGLPAAPGGPDLRSTITAVEPAGPYAGIIHCDGPGDAAQLFVDLIEANKALHDATLRTGADDPALPYRFVYAENLPLSGLAPHLRDLAFKALDNRERGGHRFTLVEVAGLAAPDLPAVRLCFAF